MIRLAILLGFLCGITIILESIPILFVKHKTEWWIASVLCNVVTNPILNCIVMLLTVLLYGSGWLPVIFLLLEIGVVFLEAYFYQCRLGESYKRCFVFSLIANSISLTAGLVLNYVILAA